MCAASNPAAPPEGGPSMRYRKRAAAKARVFDVAIQLFKQHGYAEVSVDAICAAADVAPRSFFRYFPAKEELLLDPVREMSRALEAAIARAPADLDDDQVLRFGLRHIAERNVADWSRLADFFTVAIDTETFRASPLVQLANGERAIAEHLLRRRQEPGPADWRTKLRVARAVAAYRVWLEDVRTRAIADPIAHLDELLTAP